MGVVSTSNKTDVSKKGLTDFTHFASLGQFKKEVYLWLMDIYISKRFIILASLKPPTKMVITHKKRHVYCWRKKEPPYLHTQVTQNNFSPVPDDVIQWIPLKYFKQF